MWSTAPERRFFVRVQIRLCAFLPIGRKAHVPFWRLGAIFLCFLLIAFLLYAPVRSAFFVSDDFDWLAFVRDGRTVIQHFLTTAEGTRGRGVYRPATSVSIFLDHALFGLDSRGYHATGIFLLAGTAFFLFLLVRELCIVQNWKNRAALIAALLFLAAPSNVEAAAWLSGRADVLIGFFGILCVFLFLKWMRDAHTLWLVGSVISFAIAMFAKESAIVIPALAGIMALTRGNLRKLSALFLFGIPLAAYWILRNAVTGLWFGYYGADRLQITWWGFKQMMIGSFSHLVAGGAPRAHVYDWLMRNEIWFWVLSACAVFLSLAPRASRAFAARGNLWWGIALIPAAPLLLHPYTDEGSRFFLIASMGIFMIAGILLAQIRSRTFFVLFVALALLFEGARLETRLLSWRQAGNLSRAILSDLGFFLPIGRKEQVVILTLPDSIDGAPVFRNGMKFALPLFANADPPEIILPLRTLILGDAERTRILWQRTPDGLTARAKDGLPVFVGPKIFSTSAIEMRMNGYEPHVGMSPEVEINFHEPLRSRIAEGAVALFAFDAGHLSRISWPSSR